MELGLTVALFTFFIGGSLLWRFHEEIRELKTSLAALERDVQGNDIDMDVVLDDLSKRLLKLEDT